MIVRQAAGFSGQRRPHPVFQAGEAAAVGADPERPLSRAAHGLGDRVDDLRRRRRSRRRDELPAAIRVPGEALVGAGPERATAPLVGRLQQGGDDLVRRAFPEGFEGRAAAVFAVQEASTRADPERRLAARERAWGEGADVRVLEQPRSELHPRPALALKPVEPIERRRPERGSLAQRRLDDRGYVSLGREALRGPEAREGPAGVAEDVAGAHPEPDGPVARRADGPDPGRPLGGRQRQGREAAPVVEGRSALRADPQAAGGIEGDGLDGALRDAVIRAEDADPRHPAGPDVGSRRGRTSGCPREHGGERGDERGMQATWHAGR